MVPDMSQEEVRRIIISDMVKKRNSIVPVIGEDTIVYQDEGTGKEIPFQEFIFSEFQKKYPRVTVDDAALTSMKERGYYGLSLLSQYYNEQGRFLDDFMDFVSKNASCIKLKDEVLDFLVTFNFPIIITTVCFDIIEQQLKGQIDSYKSIWYRLNAKNDTLPSRCVYHIFGQARDGSKWVYDEDCLLTFLLSHNDKDHGATGLTDFLKENEKKLFVLGCNLPNWLFRFLWQPTQTGRNSNMKTTQGYWINKEKPEDSFENFLKKKNFSADEQVKDILVDATKLLQEELKREAEERSSLEASKKQIRVWLQYSCGVTEMLLCPSLGVPFVLLLFPYGDLEMARNGFEGGSKRCAMNNTCSSVNEAGFVGLRTYVQEPMKQCSISWALNHAMKYVII